MVLGLTDNAGEGGYVKCCVHWLRLGSGQTIYVTEGLDGNSVIAD